MKPGVWLLPALAVAGGAALVGPAQVGTDRFEIEVRELAVEERERVGTLRRQMTGLLAPGLSDIELLGIAARTAEERRLYAEQFARRYRALTRAVLDFEEAVQDAHRRLFDSRQLLDANKWYASGYQWTLAPDGEADREDILRRVLAAVEAGHGSHIHLLTEDRDAALKWVRQNLPSRWLGDRQLRVTLGAGGVEALRPLPAAAAEGSAKP